MALVESSYKPTFEESLSLGYWFLIKLMIRVNPFSCGYTFGTDELKPDTVVVVHDHAVGLNKKVRLGNNREFVVTYNIRDEAHITRGYDPKEHGKLVFWQNPGDQHPSIPHFKHEHGGKIIDNGIEYTSVK